MEVLKATQLPNLVFPSLPYPSPPATPLFIYVYYLFEFHVAQGLWYVTI